MIIRITRYIVFFCLALLVILPACKAKTAAEKNDGGIIKKYSQPPITLTLSTNHRTINVAERFELTLSTVLPEDYTVSFPDFPENENSFTLYKTNDAKPRLLKAATISRGKTYILEAFLPGSYQIPALKVRCRSPENKETTLLTDELSIEVTSLLAKDEENPDISELAPVVDQPFGTMFYLLIGLAILLAGLAIYYLTKVRQRKITPAPPPLPPHVKAWRQLDKLLNSNLLERGEIKKFHQQVSDILRHYIEERFALKAPERTTEEFLVELGKTDVLRSEHKSLLHDFLTHCDLVKFARHIPPKDKSLETVKMCRSFIDQTRGQASEAETP